MASPVNLRSHFALIPSEPPPTSEDAIRFAELLSEADRLIPQKIKQSIGRPILIAFDHSRAPEKISVPICGAAPSSPSDNSPPDSLPTQTLGFSQVSRRAELPHQILLHPDIVAIAREGSERSVRFACGHHSLYRLALATIIHEVIHIYDSTAKLSQNSVYQHMQQFAPQGALRQISTYNHLRTRSPDIYEFHDIGENLAVNFEYFILDPEFKCRRPAVYQMLATQFDHQPFQSYACAVNRLVYAGNQPVYIDPARVYQIHYLFAARGKGIASRWGHSMFRLVVCSPQRKRVDASCLEDLHDHIVLSFVANLREDLTISTWKGLTGKYISQILIRPLTEILNDYTEVDYRDLQSLPLNMDEQEMRQFINHTLELYWGYSGRYYFLTNNCANESLRLLQTALPNRDIHSLRLMTPLGLRNDLIKHHIADASVLANRAAALDRGYLFPSSLDRYEELYLKFRNTLPPEAPRKFEKYLKKTKAAVRRQWALSQTQPASLSGLFTIEGVILQRLLKEIEKTILIRILFKRDPKYLELGQKLKGYMLSLRLPWELVKDGYGIPLPDEFKLEPRQVHPGFPEDILTTAMALIKVDDPDLFSEYAQSEQNRKLILSMILKSSTGATSNGVQADSPPAH